jgi:hypothetical protein
VLDFSPSLADKVAVKATNASAEEAALQELLPRITSMQTTKFSNIDPKFTSRLGQVAINWAVIENWLGHLLGTLIDADLGGASILTNEMGASTVIKAINIILDINEPEQPELKAVRELIKEADELRLDRNELVHSIWETTPDPDACSIDIIGWQRAEIVRSRIVTTTDLDQLLADLDHWMEEFVVLGRRFSFPRKRGEIKSIFA